MADPVALITGVAGQDGIHLARLLRSLGYSVHGTTHSAVGALGTYLAGVHMHRGDVRDGLGFGRLLAEVRPDEVYNLAGFSSVGASWENASLVTEANASAVVSMLEEIVAFRERTGWAPRFFQASSAEMFGPVSTQPQDEGTPHDPRTPYAAAKSFAHQMVVAYRDYHSLFTATGILYNHESAVRGPQFVTRKLSQAVARIALGLDDHVTLGDLSVRRDWGSAADHVRAMQLAMAHAEPGDYVIATGHSWLLEEVVAMAFAAAGLGDPAPYVRQDRALLRRAEVPELRGDPTRARDLLGWSPRHSLEQTLTAMVQADLTRLSSGPPESPAYLLP